MKFLQFFFTWLFILSMSSGVSSLVFAQWMVHPNVNTAISTTAGSEQYPTIVSDGSGGAIITWHDNRSGNYDIYAQRINSSGVVQWTANGVVISTAAGNQEYPTIVSDGTGGAIITWGNVDIYAQRINSEGVVQWTANGVAISTAANNQQYPTIVSDGSGGAIITWYDTRSGAIDIYAQRINSAGVVQWTADGVAISTAANSQLLPTIVSDNSGGAIITWYDNRSGNYDIYAQRINSSGVVQWTAHGVAISTATSNQQYPTIVIDGSGGAIITWQDHRASNPDIYAQKVNSEGVVQWTADGVGIATGTLLQQKPTLVSDDSGGAMITYTSGTSTDDIYAQRINSSGVVQWTANGVAITTAAGDQLNPTIVSDGSGGAIIAWGNADIYAQRINSAGVVQWTTDGVAISTAASTQAYPTMVSNSSGGAIITWQDNRSGNNIYAQNIISSGFIGMARNAMISTIQDVPNDQGGSVRVRWQKSPDDTGISVVQIVSYGVWRKIPPSLLAKKLMGRTLRAMDDTLGTLYDFIVNVPAVQSPYYNVVAQTLEDSSSAGTNNFSFLVTAHTANPNLFYISPADSGHSVDNLSPSAVVSVTAEVQSGPLVKIHWSPILVDPDVGYYEVHRSTSSGFIPSPGTKIGWTTDTLFTDNSPVTGTTNYYRLITVDIHGNHSVPSAEATATMMITAQYNFSDRWNMVSIPLIVNDYTKTILFPTATTNAFAYEADYVAYGTLSNGVGYWLKFSGSQQISMTGFPRESETIAVQVGWNMIGSISSSVDVTTITSNPPGLITSQFFSYENGYDVSTTIEPGKGYWVKVNQAGTLTLSSVASNQYSENSIKIVSTNEQPPPPPTSETTNQKPQVFNLEQNHPNPFNPSTVIRYSLPVTGLITLKVYNMLGQEVATLLDNQEMEQGEYEISFNANMFATGVYFYRINVESVDEDGMKQIFTDVKRMLLLK